MNKTKTIEYQPGRFGIQSENGKFFWTSYPNYKAAEKRRKMLAFEHKINPTYHNADFRSQQPRTSAFGSHTETD